MQERGFLFFGVGFDLVELDHRRNDGLHVSDASLLRILVPERLEPLAHHVRRNQRHRTPRLLSRANPSGSSCPAFAAFKAAARSGSVLTLRHVSGH